MSALKSLLIHFHISTFICIVLIYILSIYQKGSFLPSPNQTDIFHEGATYYLDDLHRFQRRNVNCTFNIAEEDWNRARHRVQFDEGLEELLDLVDLDAGNAEGSYKELWRSKTNVRSGNQCLSDPYNRASMIREQLEAWRHGISHEDVLHAWHTRMQHPLLRKQTAYVQIVDQKLYIAAPEDRHSHASRCLESFIPWMQFLLAMSSPLPNVEFILNLYAGEHEADSLVPVFSYCKGSGKHILIPRMYFNERRKWERNSPERLDTWNSKFPWESKKEKLVFRGVSTDESRVQLALQALDHLDIMDIGITQYLPYRLHEWTQVAQHPRLQETIKPRMSMKDQLGYKYFINLDGVACADRLPVLLASNSVVLLPESTNHEYWYHLMEPWKHYVPVESDHSDIVQKIQWLKEHDHEAKRIAEESTRFILDVQGHDEIHCYMMQMLKEYASIFVDANPSPLPYVSRVHECSVER